MASRFAAVVAVLVLGGGPLPLDALSSELLSAPVNGTCEDFVYLKDGKLKAGANGYQLKGTNFAATIGARIPTSGALPSAWDYFLAPIGGYYPDNDAVCQVGSLSTRCCGTSAACKTMLLGHDVQRLIGAGVGSVRLVGLQIRFDTAHHPYISCDLVHDANASTYPWDYRCKMDISTSADVQKAIAIYRDAIRTLGANGIRSILLLGDSGVEEASNHPQYLSLLSQIATGLATEPYLIAYDPYNEPGWAYDMNHDAPEFNVCGPDKFCREAARAVSKSWFEALKTRSADSLHLVTVGNVTPSGALSTGWDPYVIYDHFTSYHLYPETPWAPAGEIHASRTIANEIYGAALGACGTPCPFVGSWDTANCYVGEAPVNSTPFIWRDGFYYNYLPRPRKCPIGVDDGAHCWVAGFDHGRDKPFLLGQPLFYVVPGRGNICPTGTTFDGANCYVASAPPGATPFIWRGAYYYNYLSPKEHCRAPAWDDSAHCYVAPVPTGYSPFIGTKPLYYVTATRCGPRKPAYFGEIGFATFPNGVDLTVPPSFYPPEAFSSYQECATATGNNRASGSDAEANEFLFGNTSFGWKGVFPMSRDCGFQGMHWWMYGSVHWGICNQDNFGLYTNFYNRQATAPVGDPEALVSKSFVTPFKNNVDYLATGGKCGRPADFLTTTDRGVTMPKFRYQGRVLHASTLAPVPYALLFGWESGWGPLHKVWANADGEFSLDFNTSSAQIVATQYGFNPATKYPPSMPAGSTLQVLNIGNFLISPVTRIPDQVVDLKTPSVPKRACLNNGTWVIQP